MFGKLIPQDAAGILPTASLQQGEHERFCAVGSSVILGVRV
jgi:hypothetical protein